MAELLAVVASGIAVAQAAQSLGEIAVSLSRLWRDIKDVPNTIRDLVEELEVAGKVFSVIESELEPPPESGSTPLTSLQCLTIERCRQAHKDLGALVDDLRADIASSRRRKKLLASVKVVLKKDTLEAYERRLQRALRFLDSAVQLHMASSVKRQPDLVAAKVTDALVLKGVFTMALAAPGVEEIKTNEEEKETSLSPSSELSRRSRAVQNRRKYYYSSMLLGSLGIELYEAAEVIGGSGTLKSSCYRYRVAPPRWLLKNIWDIQITRAYSGWKTVFRQHVVVSDNSEVFRVMESGPFERLLELFDKGLASPFSVDDEGSTLLHYAVEYRFDFVEPLLHMGLDPLVEDIHGSSAFEMNAFNGSESQIMALHQLSLAQGVYGTVINEIPPWVMQRMIGAPQVFDSMVANIFPDFYQWPLEHRTRLLAYPLNFGSLSSKIVRRLFRPHGGFHPDDLLHRMPGTGQTIFHWVTEQYFHQWLMVYDWYDWPDWRDDFDLFNKGHLKEAMGFIHDIVAASQYSDLSATGGRGRTTALLEGIRSFTEGVTRFWIYSGRVYNAHAHRLTKRCAQQIVKDWLEALRAGGKDLEVFGQAELTILLRHRSSGSPGWNTRGARYGWKGLTVGPRPEDWHLIWEWDPDVEGFVGDFWEWIENPPLSIPGSWVDDDDDDDDGDDFEW